MSQELGDDGTGIPGLGLDGWRSSGVRPAGLDLLLQVAWSLRFLSVRWISSWFICTRLAPASEMGCECQCNSFGKGKKMLLAFRQTVILFLENRAINPAYAKQTLCNVCIKLGGGELCQKRKIFVIHLSEHQEMLFSLYTECLIFFIMPASWPHFLLSWILISSLQSSVEKKNISFSDQHIGLWQQRTVGKVA